MRERKIISLTDELHQEICTGDAPEGWKLVKEGYTGSGRHTEQHFVIYEKDGKEFYKIAFQTSVKDEMGWYDCNLGINKDAVQVFPKIVVKTEYE